MINPGDPDIGAGVPAPDAPPATIPIAQPAPQKRGLGFPLALGAAGLVVGIGVGLGLGVVIGRGLSSVPEPKPAANAVAAPARTTQAPPPPPATSYHVPTKDDFTLSVKVLSKQCFGSAGCNVTYRVQLKSASTFVLDPNKSYEVTYQVRGLEDQTIDTLTVTGDEYTVPRDEMGSTKSSSSKLTAVITGVTEA